MHINKETIIQNEIRCALSPYGVTFRTNAGKFYSGKRIFSTEFMQDVLTDLRPVVGLPQGFSDTLFVGQGKVAFVEIKTPTGRPTKEQEHFLQTMRDYGHIAGIVRSPEEAVRLITL